MPALIPPQRLDTKEHPHNSDPVCVDNVHQTAIMPTVMQTKL